MPLSNAARRLPIPCLFGLTAGLAAGFLIWLWSFSPLAETLDMALLARAVDLVQSSQFAHLLLVAGYILASVLVFPFSVLDAFTIAVFGPVQGGIYAYCLSVGCALWMFVLVRYFRRKPARVPARLLPAQWAHVVNEPGLAAVAIARNLPISFSLNNVLFALSAVRTRDYVIGTLVGCFFPVLVLSIVFSQTQKAFLDPSLWHFGCLALVLLAALTLYLLFRKLVAGRGKDQPNQPQAEADTHP